MPRVDAVLPPAGGAALDEVFGLAAAGLVATGLFAALAFAHRTGRTTVLVRAAELAGRQTGRCGWVALPSLLSAAALLIALFGMLWDISLHVGQGRDVGPLANPSHYFILVGLALLLVAGLLAVVLPLGEDPGPASVRITDSWRAPVGGLLITGASSYALLGFPLDDLWHRQFGQDVTLWGPTHLMLITGAGLSLVGLLVLEQEGHATQPAGEGASRVVSQLVRVFLFGGLLAGLSVFQGEYDFGIPQFRLVLQPLMIAGAAGFALVAVRLVGGRGAALGAAVFFLLLRGGISLMVGPVLGEPTPSMPLYLGSALLVEAVALTALARRPLRFAVVAGLLVGTVGTATETLWSYAVMPLPWTRDVWVEGLLTAVPVAVAGALAGALLALGVQGRLPRVSLARPVLVGALLVVAAGTANGLVATVPAGAAATVSLTPAGQGLVTAEVVLSPATLADDPAWLSLTAWQGGGLVVDRLERTGVGTYRSTRPAPVDGTWKTVLRLNDGRTLTASPVFLAADPVIDAPVVAADAQSTRTFVSEVALLQRERDLSVPGWTWAVSALFVLACSLALVAGLAWGVARLSARIPASRVGDDIAARVVLAAH